MWNKGSLFWLLLLCGSCKYPLVDRSAQTQPPPVSPSLEQVKQSDTVEIHNDWNGYSDITPIARHCKLRLENQELVGNAYIAVGGYGAAGIHQQATTKVKIPAAITAQFLATLAQTPIERGIYQPKLGHPDDYPNVKIQVGTIGHQTTFSSKSQGIDRTPWQVKTRSTSAGKTDTQYISNSATPAQALRLLSPYLGNTGIDGIIQRRVNRK